jgi:hypothetical protein
MTVQETLKEAAKNELSKECMGIINQLFDLTEISVEKRQSINDIADEYLKNQILRLFGKLQQEQDKKLYSEGDMMFAYEQGARLALISQSDLARVKGKFPTPREWFDDLKTYKI